MPVSQAKVKCVLSGDTLVLTSVNNPDQERTLSLAFVSAPRLRREGDEPYAFQSRDFLRRMTVGKVIQFITLYSIPTGAKREYGRVYLQSGEILPDTAVSEGWVKLREDASRRDESDDSRELLENLQRLEDKAKSSSKGLWSSSGGNVQTSYEVPDPKAFVGKWKGKPLDAIVEKVLAGDRMIVRMMLSATEHVQTMVLVAGIKAPMTKRTHPSDGKEQPAEPLAHESCHFVETRLMQRTVKVDVLGTTPQGGLICSVRHPNGSIAEFLLKAGLARCNDFHSSLLAGDMAALRKAEKLAKDARIGLFKGLTQPKGGAEELDATITRIQTADTVYLRDKTGEERRVSLSSIRQPKPTDPKQAPFSADAKEFLRKKLIGKHVKVIIDGRKEANEGYEARDVVTIMLNDKNVGLQLVEAGYASVIRHRQDDQDRSPVYDDLLAAEVKAQAEQKGMWSPKPPAVKTYQDYSETLQKAKIQSSVLQRQKRVPAIVDYVKGGSRFTLILPRENAKLTFVLSGIRAPRSARNANEKSEPFGQEAHDFANRRCMQREVEISVEAVDKVGGFIGTLYLNRENVAKLLLEEGLASVHAYSAEQSGNANELFAAEERAKAARKGMWHDYDPSITDGVDDLTLTEPATNGDDAGAEIKKDYRDVLVTHIDPTTVHLKLQMIGPSTTGALTSLMSAFASHHRSPPASEKTLPGGGPPKAGDYVSARFSDDGEWYRARIRRNDREAKKADVVFIDYGNSETLPWTELRPLPPATFGVQKLKAQAVEVGLSYLQFPSSREYAEEAVRFLQDLTDGKPLVASVDCEDKDKDKDAVALWVTLFEADQEGAGEKKEEESINAELVAEGCAMVRRKLRAWELRRGKGSILDALRQREERAKEAKRGMWEYGDISDD
ncbi:MAG: hypothetical protein Q9163_001748 [Psora crenata]